MSVLTTGDRATHPLWRRILRWTAFGAAALAAVALIAFLTWFPRFVDRRLNVADPAGPYAASPDAEALHQTLRVADLHADLLLWTRDPLVRGTSGHTDVPRLLAGNVAVEVFSAVTKVPWGLNYERNPSDSDLLTALVIAQRWPPRTWASTRARALYEAAKLHDAARRSDGRLVVVRSSAELAAFLERRRVAPATVAGILALEGLHVLEGDPRHLDPLFAAGFRIMGLAHFFDNAVAGSAHGEAKGGLTTVGRDVVRRMEEQRILVDLAHASPAAMRDVLAMTSRPVVVSHTGVQATCPGPRNLSDDLLRAVARTGGVIGIGFWDGAVCETDPASIARAIRHAADVAGVDHVGLGSDFDGATRLSFDATGLVQVTEALMAVGFTSDEIRLIMGENVIRLLLEALP